MKPRFAVHVAIILLAFVVHMTAEDRPEGRVTGDASGDLGGLPLASHQPVMDVGQAQGSKGTPPEPAPPVYQITWYCLNEQPMASGRPVYPGAVATDGLHPLGDRLYIEGMGPVTVEDRFAADLMQRRLDVWIASCEEAIQLGVQHKAVRKGE